MLIASKRLLCFVHFVLSMLNLELSVIGIFKLYVPGTSRQGLEWLSQCQDNETMGDIRSWCWRHCLPVGQHNKVALPDMIIDAVRM